MCNMYYGVIIVSIVTIKLFEFYTTNFLVTVYEKLRVRVLLIFMDAKLLVKNDFRDTPLVPEK